MSVHLPQLIDELAILRHVLTGRATQPEHEVAITSLAQTELAVKAGETAQVSQCLKQAGPWAWEVATEIGTLLAAETLKKSMGR